VWRALPPSPLHAQVLLTGARACDATLAVLDGSHKHWPGFFQTFKVASPGDDWQKLDGQAQLAYFTDRGCKEVRVAAPEGAMILWNSRAWDRRPRAHVSPRCAALSR
jgi:hypothetical protein